MTTTTRLPPRNPNIQKDLRTAESLIFASVFQAYMECSNEIQDGIRDMIAIVNDAEADEQEKALAVHSLVEALFPNYDGDGLGRDLTKVDQAIGTADPTAAQIAAEMDGEEATFAEQLKAAMDSKGFNQRDLADAIGVGQPAISMMLSRDCRPQRKTVEKLAKALEVAPEKLWPFSR